MNIRPIPPAFEITTFSGRFAEFARNIFHLEQLDSDAQKTLDLVGTAIWDEISHTAAGAAQIARATQHGFQSHEKGARIHMTPTEIKIQAIKDYRHAATLGDLATQYDMGRRFTFGENVEQDIGEGVLNLQKARKEHVPGSGSGAAQYLSAQFFSLGIYNHKKDFEAAKLNLFNAGTNNQVSACRVIGEMTRKGSKRLGIAKNLVQAENWHLKAANLGDAFSANKYGEIIGAKDNEPEKAFKYFQLSADKFYMPAVQNLIVCYENGYGIEKSEAMVARWRQTAEAIAAGAQPKPKVILPMQNWIRPLRAGHDATTVVPHIVEKFRSVANL